MVETGKSSEDWDDLPISDTKLIMAYLSARREASKNDQIQIMEALFGGKKG